MRVGPTMLVLAVLLGCVATSAVVHADAFTYDAPTPPNSIWQQIRADGTRSVTYYDATGEPFSREDYGQQRGHGDLDASTPHEHRPCFNDLGQPMGKYYRELDANGKPIGPWIKG